MDFKIANCKMEQVVPSYCLVCFSSIQPNKYSSDNIKLDVFSNILRLSPSIYQGLDIDKLQDPLYCPACTQTILNALEILQEIKNLENSLSVLTGKLKQDLIQGYSQWRLCNDGANSDSSEDSTINLIRKTFVQCWSDCHVKLERGAILVEEIVPEDESDNIFLQNVDDDDNFVDDKLQSEDDRDDEDEDDDEDYQVRESKNNGKSRKSKQGRTVSRKSNSHSNQKLVGLRSLVTSKQQRNRTNLPFKCSQCGKGYQIESSLQLHEKCHAGDLNFQCSICDSKFVSKRSLHLHENRRHQKKTEEKPYGKVSCTVCGKEFQTDQNLNAHIASVHENSFKFTCGICNAGFNIKSALLNHEKYVHTTTKRFECEICQKRFKRSHQLFYHKRVHTGERLICEICGRRFMQPEKLKWHLEAHTGEKRYPCPFCGKCFAVKNYVSSHIYATHEGRRKPRSKSSTNKLVETEQPEQEQQHNIITFNIIESSSINTTETQIVVMSDNVPL